jgi:peptidyl-prolyl cis-trans isomerase B (cyclophilin B)
MAVFASPSSRAVARLAAAGLLAAASVIGCNRAEPQPEPEPPAPVQDNESKASPVALDPRLHQAFAEATRPEPPLDYPRPPEKTMTGKSVGPLYTEVKEQLWDTIRYTSPEGKRLDYRAVLDTELGEIEIVFLPEVAPNHVRNFLALAKAGYYDGLIFERTVQEKTGDKPEDTLHVLEAGCPLGLGDIGLGSIGYWLKPETSKLAGHEPGAVGACRGAEMDTAACRFYISLDKAPLLDGHYSVFGRVTRGLDVARKIFEQPVRVDDEFPEGDRPLKPVVIRKVTIHSTEVDNLAANAENK